MISRVAAVVAGLVGAIVVLTVGGLLAGLSDCGDPVGATLFCPRHQDLANALEIASLIPGVVAPLVGGITSSIRSELVWLVGGWSVGALALTVLGVLASGQ